MTKVIELGRDESIIAVVPEVCSGPGWSNHVVWVYIQQADKHLRTEAIQSAEMSLDLRTLFAVGATLHKELVGAVKTKESGKYSNRVKVA